MLFFLSSLSLSLAGDVCVEMDCSLLKHIETFSVEEADERWNMKPRQTRGSTYRYISSLQANDSVLENSKWTPLYWQKYLIANDIREKMAALEWIHRSHKSQIRNGEYTSLLSLQELLRESTTVIKNNPPQRDIILMALIECSQILSISDQITFHRMLMNYYNEVDVSPLSAQSLRIIDTSQLNEHQRDELQGFLAELLVVSNQPSEVIRATDWLKMYDIRTQKLIINIVDDAHHSSNKSFDSEIDLRSLRYFEHCNMEQAQILIRTYQLQSSQDSRVQRLAQKIMQSK